MTNLPELPRRGLAAACGLFTALSLAAACGGADSASGTAPSADVWAVVDGRPIQRDTVDKAYRNMVLGATTAPSVEEMLELKLNILDELITQDIMLARARTLGVEATDVEIDNALAEQKRSMSDQDFQKQLADRGLTLDDIRQSLRREISAQKLVEREITSRIAISDDDIAAFYNANRAQFNLTEPHVRLAQILITPQRDPQLQNRRGDDAATPDEAKRKAEMITGRLQSGVDFAELALDYSEDPQSVAQGGDLGLVPESALGSLPPALRTAVRDMQPGTASTVSIGPNYAVIMLVGREPAGQRELGSAPVRDGIRDLLRTRREQLLQQAYIAHLRDTASVENHLVRQVVETQGRVPGQTVETTAAAAAPAPATGSAPAPAPPTAR
jgi:peptidyl-prolyl cis-trans isomerase SurA